MDGIIATMALDGPIHGDWFESYVTQLLMPAQPPGEIVIMGNLSSHERATVQEQIVTASANIRFFSPYSRKFNPIEKAFSRLKAMLRKAAKRTVKSLWNHIGELVNKFQPNECASYFKSCGYEPV